MYCDPDGTEKPTTIRLKALYLQLFHFWSVTMLSVSPGEIQGSLSGTNTAEVSSINLRLLFSEK